MHDDLHAPPKHARKFSLAQQGVGARLLIAVGLVALVWAMIVPLVS